MLRRMSDKRLQTIGKWLTAYDAAVNKPGNDVYNSCRIWVPHRHLIYRAVASFSDVDVNTSLTARLFRWPKDVDFAGGGQAISGAAQALSATADLISATELSIASADRESGPCSYLMSFIGGHADDLAKQPTLSILILPVPRVAV